MTTKSEFLLLFRGFLFSTCSYFDVNLLNKKMVGTKIALKSRFALILHALKSRFHCTWYLTPHYSSNSVCFLPLLPQNTRKTRYIKTGNALAKFYVAFIGRSWVPNTRACSVIFFYGKIHHGQALLEYARLFFFNWSCTTARLFGYGR